MQEMYVVLLFTVVHTASVCQKSITRASGTHVLKKGLICSGDLIFEDNFDKLDHSIWQHENTLAGGGNWEFQWYTNNRTNSYAEKGILKIKPSLTADHLGDAALYSATLDLSGGTPADECTNSQFYGCSRTGTRVNILNPIKSARIRTVSSFSFCYGRIEVRAKLPLGDWIWPAIWMLPKYNPYGIWPASGAMIIVQSRGNANLIKEDINIGAEQMESTLDWGPDTLHNGYIRTHAFKNNVNGFNSDFHVYETIWTNSSIKFRVNRNELFSVELPAGGFWELGQFNSIRYSNPWARGTKMAPFDEEFYIVMNLAVGGVSGFFPDDASNPTDKPWSNKSPRAATDFWRSKSNWLPTWDLKNDGSALQVDYVRVYAL